jgi:hypothetical protein
MRRTLLSLCEVVQDRRISRKNCVRESRKRRTEAAEEQERENLTKARDGG